PPRGRVGRDRRLGGAGGHPPDPRRGADPGAVRARLLRRAADRGPRRYRVDVRPPRPRRHRPPGRLRRADPRRVHPVRPPGPALWGWRARAPAPDPPPWPDGDRSKRAAGDGRWTHRPPPRPPPEKRI